MKEITYDKHNAFVVDTTAIQVKIKGILKDGIIQGVPKSEIDKKVVKAVDGFAKNIRSPSIRERYLRTLASNYNKWYQMFYASVQAVKAFEKTNALLIKTANTKGFEGTVFNFDTRNFRTSEERATVVIADYKNQVKKAYADIIKELSKDELKDNVGVSLRNFAEIRVRWEANRDDIERLKAEGVTHVWASSHANCSERCSHWQGQLYSLYDDSGTLDEIPFQPLSKAMRGIKNDDNGLLGYNCRHRIIPYFKGSTPPKEYTKEQIKKEYELDQKQRYLERKIRQKKEDAFLLKGVDNKLSKELFGQARELTDEYREFSEQNNRPAYIYRTQIMREEMPVLKELHKNELNDIIKTETKDGVKIQNVSAHMQMRMIERTVNNKNTIDALDQPLKIKPDKIDEDGGISRKYIGKLATVIINPETGNVITTYVTGTEVRKKYERQQNKI